MMSAALGNPGYLFEISSGNRGNLLDLNGLSWKFFTMTAKNYWVFVFCDLIGTSH